MIIDTHAHMLPQSTLEALRSESKNFPSVNLIESEEKYQLSFNGGKPTRPIMLKLRMFLEREQFLLSNGIDLQISGGWLDSFGYEIEPEEGADWSRFLNEGMLTDCKGRDELVPLATVPMQSGKLQ